MTLVTRGLDRLRRCVRGLSRAWAGRDPPAAVLAGLGVAFGGTYLWYVTGNEAYLRGPVWLPPVGLGLVLVLAAGLLYAGYWLARSEFSTDEGWLVTTWVFAGVLAAVALTFWPIFYQRVVGVAVADPVFILLVSGGLGANAGVVAGTARVQSERRLRDTTRTRDSLEFLNRLLRHNVLNAVQVIRGNAELLLSEAPDDETAARARSIRRQSDRTDALVGNTGALIRRIEGDLRRERVDLSETVEAEVESAREVYPEAVIEADVEPGLTVDADGLVSAVVANLVRNAVVHSDREAPRVEVTLREREGSVVLRVADDGPGIPAAERSRVTDPGPHGDHGVGLYLVAELVEEYGATLSFAENEPRGTVATVRFP